MAWVEKDHNAHQFQPPAMCRVTNQQPRLPRATSSLALNACRDGASTPPWATCSVRHHPLGEKLPHNIQPRPPQSQIRTILPCPITIHPHKQPFPSCLYTALKYWKATMSVQCVFMVITAYIPLRGGDNNLPGHMLPAVL